MKSESMINEMKAIQQQISAALFPILYMVHCFDSLDQ